MSFTPVNLDKPHHWKADIVASVDMYNDWFLRFAPQAFRSTRLNTTREVETALLVTGNLTDIKPDVLRQHPEILPTLRMSACPPLAVDRLIGLAGLVPSFVRSMEMDKRLPPRMSVVDANVQLVKIAAIIERMADPDIFVWIGRTTPATDSEIYRAATIIADRLCSAVANPIIRNAQEKRQFAAMKAWLEARGYSQISTTNDIKFNTMRPGTFSFRMNVPVMQEGGTRSINIPIDVVIMPKTATDGDMPIFFEAKSAGDFTNVNKRRKEEAAKMGQLRTTYGTGIRFTLFLCGYFDSGYLGYEAAEGIDWVWEHRIDDLALFGI
ncbi:MAG: XamI family restriction endonuclease [Magnetococcales bacterium]|nr:XamI family restriction endonuclease [Magnetococcales bacterium]